MVPGGGPGTGLLEAMRVLIPPPTVGVPLRSRPVITGESSVVPCGRADMGGCVRVMLRSARAQVTGEPDSQSPGAIVSLSAVFHLLHLKFVAAGLAASDPG
jgi:hypothetical protein